MKLKLNTLNVITRYLCERLLLPAITIFPVVGLGIDATADTAVNDSSKPVGTAAELQRTAAEYEAEIEKLQSSQGVYDPFLGENLASLGLVYQQLGDHKRALAALKRAMQIRRVNEGLQNLGQIPILKEIIESNTRRGNWEEVDQNYDQMLWVYRRNYAEDDQNLLPIISQVGLWKIHAYRNSLLGRNSLETIMEAERLFDKTIKLLEIKHGETDQRLIDPLYGHALTSYQLMIETMNRPVSEFQNRQTSSPVEYVRVCRSTKNGTVCYLRPVTNYSYYTNAQRDKDFSVQRHMSEVKRDLEQIVRILDSNPELSAASKAQALVHLGDWNMLAGRRNTANKQYKTAYTILARSTGENETINELFAKPTPIPALRMALPAAEEPDLTDQERKYVKVTFDISKTGGTRNIRVTEESDPDDRIARRKALKKVKDSRYRPRFENGEAVDTTGYTVQVNIE